MIASVYGKQNSLPQGEKDHSERTMQVMKKKNNKKGFTLAELLIVVAIIAVLTAIAIPVFSTQLEKSREATDQANVRSAYAEVMTQYLTDPDNDHTMTVTAKQQQTGWQGTPGSVTTMIDGTESIATYDAATGTYTVTITDSGSFTITKTDKS